MLAHGLLSIVLQRSAFIFQGFQVIVHISDIARVGNG